MRQALETGRAGPNGEVIWDALRIGDWASSHPPAPVLDQLRNDVALLLAEDVDETIELLPIPPEMAGAAGTQDVPRAEFLDFAVGYWAFSVEVVRRVRCPHRADARTALRRRRGTPGRARRTTAALMALDAPRAPSALDPLAGLYKDWLHLNLFDPASGLIGLVNVAAHGAPGDPQARAVGAALVHVPGHGWAGNLEAHGARRRSVRRARDRAAQRRDRA